MSRETESKHAGGWRQRVIHELRHTGLVALYFLVAFTTIGVLKMLFLAEFGVEGFAVTSAILGALVVGKVVAVLDMTAYGERFARSPLAVFVFWRSLAYTLAVLAFIAFEKVGHGVWHGETLGGAVETALEAANVSRFLGNALALFVCFVGYNLVTGVARRLGSEGLVSLMFSKPSA